MKTLKILLTAAMLALSVAACEDKGPFEEAGESVDEAVDDAGDAIEDACEDATGEDCD